VAAALLATLCGCSAGSSASGDATASPSPSSSGGATTGSAPAPSAGLARFYRQKLTWTACRTGDQCAELSVPLDYARPADRSISISVLKVPATGRRIGSLVLNPGGPGASGVDYAAAGSRAVGTTLTRSYDVVGFDPRGVASSTPLSCVSDARLSHILDSDQEPATARERRQFDATVRGFGEACLRSDPGLTRHMSTVEVAKDVDVLRQALGDPELTYYGASYGTAIGAEYAQLFPRRVGRMVLDGAVDPSTSTVQSSLVQAHGFEVALRAYVGACVRRGSCFLGSSVDAGARRIKRFLDGLDAQPLPAGNGRVLTQSDALYGLAEPLYVPAYWSYLDEGLTQAFDGDGSLMMRLADAYLRRDASGRYDGNLFQALNAVNCLDKDDGVPTAQVARYLPRFRRASPTFGDSFAYGMATCALWPVHSGHQPAPVRAAGSPPILVVGTTRDPATPLVWARSLARQLDKGVLVTRDGDGHTGFRQGSSCVDRTVEGYLVDGTVPSSDVSCS
jgi:pimeloyl-ACP methyl ester carboxylesterase